MNDYKIINGELYHYGVKGMKWGHRMARGHAGPGRYLTRKRQLAGDKRDLQTLNKGGHLSVGLTKKRQAAYDARDKKALEKRIAKNETKVEKKQLTPEEKTARNKKLVKAGVAVAGTALAAYGAYKFHDYIRSENAKIAKKRGNEAFFSVINSHDNKKTTVKELSSSFKRKAAKYQDAHDDYIGKAREFSNNRTLNKKYLRKASDALNDRDVRLNSARRADDVLKKLQSKEVFDRVYDNARKAEKDTYNSVKNADFLDATKNVYDEYRKRKRK